MKQTLNKLLGASWLTSLGGIGMWIGAALMLYSMFKGYIQFNEANVGITVALLGGGQIGWSSKAKTVTGVETGNPETTTAIDVTAKP